MLDQSGSPCIQVHIQIGRENVYNFSTLHKFINYGSLVSIIIAFRNLG